jgi:hypothetical protein
LGIDVSVSSPGAPSGDPIESSVWLPMACDLVPDSVLGPFTVTGLAEIERRTGDTVAAAARRYGLGDTLVLPWDVLAPANDDALPLLDQALEFVMPSEPRQAVTGLPFPVSLDLSNPGDEAATIRLRVEVPPAELLDVWDDPVSVDPVIWETTLPADGTTRRTLWLAPADGTGTIDLVYELEHRVDNVWVDVDGGTISIDVHETDRDSELRALRRAVDACSADAHDPSITAVLRDILAAVDRVAVAGEDREAAELALLELGRAFSAAENEEHPCLAGLRAGLADLTVLWQARWVSSGDQP